MIQKVGKSVEEHKNRCRSEFWMLDKSKQETLIFNSVAESVWSNTGGPGIDPASDNFLDKRG